MKKMNRIIDITQESTRLSCYQENLVIEVDGVKNLFPFMDIAALILSNRQVILTQPVLASLASHNIVAIVCDAKHLPCGMLLPLSAHYAQTQVFDIQSRLALPAKKRVWRSLIKAKIKAQGEVLSKTQGDDFGLMGMVHKVKSGDTTNIEGRAARRYWTMLFGPGFKRDWQAKDQNSMLNYGCAIIRGLGARSLCASGLHPCLGVHHHHRSNPFALADDFIEPLRPLVDFQVWRWYRQNEDPGVGLTKEAKSFLLSRFTDRFEIGGQYRTLFSGLNQMASSFVKVCRGESTDIAVPSLPLGYSKSTVP